MNKLYSTPSLLISRFLSRGDFVASSFAQLKQVITEMATPPVVTRPSARRLSLSAKYPTFKYEHDEETLNYRRSVAKARLRVIEEERQAWQYPAVEQDQWFGTRRSVINLQKRKDQLERVRIEQWNKQFQPYMKSRCR